MKEKVLKYLRWIFFLPLSALFAIIMSTIEIVFTRFFVGETFVVGCIEYFSLPVLQSFCFFAACCYLIPSTRYVKTRIPLIIILLLFPIALVIHTLYFYAVIVGTTEFEFKFVARLLGNIVVFIIALYCLFTKDGQKELDSGKL